MKRRDKKIREGGIPTDSFSDIAFLLIIYFLVATTLVRVQAITTEMPSGDKAAQAQSEKTPIVNLRGGQMFFNDAPVTIEGLEEGLALAAAVALLRDLHPPLEGLARRAPG